jgi:hypothetical protein
MRAIDNNGFVRTETRHPGLDQLRQASAVAV